MFITAFATARISVSQAKWQGAFPKLICVSIPEVAIRCGEEQPTRVPPADRIISYVRVKIWSVDPTGRIWAPPRAKYLRSHDNTGARTITSPSLNRCPAPVQPGN